MQLVKEQQANKIRQKAWIDGLKKRIVWEPLNMKIFSTYIKDINRNWYDIHIKNGVAVK